MGWVEMTNRTCRELGGFDPDARHRANDSVLALVARGLAVTLLPELVASTAQPGVVARPITGARCTDDLRSDAQHGRPTPVRPGTPRRDP
jgi:hypothetical protein